MVAFNAKRFVCSDISAITCVTLLISLVALPNLSIFVEASWVFKTALVVTFLPWSEFSAIWVMEPFNCSAAEETILIFVVACSTAAATEFMFKLMPSAAWFRFLAFPVISSALFAILEESVDRFREEELTIITFDFISTIMDSSFSINELNQMESSPISSLDIISSRFVRSPSPLAISFKLFPISFTGFTTIVWIKIKIPAPKITMDNTPIMMRIVRIFFAGAISSSRSTPSASIHFVDLTGAKLTIISFPAWMYSINPVFFAMIFLTKSREAISKERIFFLSGWQMTRPFSLIKYPYPVLPTLRGLMYLSPIVFKSTTANISPSIFLFI